MRIKKAFEDPEESEIQNIPSEVLENNHGTLTKRCDNIQYVSRNHSEGFHIVIVTHSESIQ